MADEKIAGLVVRPPRRESSTRDFSSPPSVADGKVVQPCRYRRCKGRRIRVSHQCTFLLFVAWRRMRLVGQVRPWSDVRRPVPPKGPPPRARSTAGGAAVGWRWGPRWGGWRLLRGLDGLAGSRDGGLRGHAGIPRTGAGTGRRRRSARWTRGVARYNATASRCQLNARGRGPNWKHRLAVLLVLLIRPSQAAADDAGLDALAGQRLAHGHLDLGAGGHQDDVRAPPSASGKHIRAAAGALGLLAQCPPAPGRSGRSGPGPSGRTGLQRGGHAAAVSFASAGRRWSCQDGAQQASYSIGWCVRPSSRPMESCVHVDGEMSIARPGTAGACNRKDEERAAVGAECRRAARCR